MRELRLFAILDDERAERARGRAPSTTTAATGSVREALSHQYDLGSREPNIQVWNVNLRGDRSLTLRHFQHNDRPLHDSAQEVLKHVARLWGFGVQLESVNAAGEVTKRWSVTARRTAQRPQRPVGTVPAPCIVRAGPARRAGRHGARPSSSAGSRRCAHP